jgi:quercetin dioxygenase-like cupin family protein
MQLPIVGVTALTDTGFPPIRRVVTGHDHRNLAQVIVDGPATNAKYPTPGLVSTLLWSTDSTPARIPIGESPEDMGTRVLGSAPPPNGSRFAIIDFAPGKISAMHRTETIDYVIVIEGELEMDMDASTVKLKQGDVMIQRGTNHAWCNRSDKRARAAFVLIDAEPLGIGHPVLGTESAR